MKSIDLAEIEAVIKILNDSWHNDPTNCGDRSYIVSKVVTDKKGGFIGVGLALNQIRNERLYKWYGTFDSYCRTYFHLTAGQANKIAKASHVALRLAPLPAYQAQVLPLLSIPFDQRDEAWKLAFRLAGDSLPSQAQVHKAIYQLSHNQPKQFMSSDEFLRSSVLNVSASSITSHNAE